MTIKIDSKTGSVMLWGTTTGEDANGNQSYTFAQYQDTNLNVSWDQNSWFNPLGHISIGIGNNQQLGLNPASDAQYVTHLIFDIFGCVGKTTCDALRRQPFLVRFSPRTRTRLCSPSRFRQRVCRRP